MDTKLIVNQEHEQNQYETIKLINKKSSDDIINRDDDNHNDAGSCLQTVNTNINNHRHQQHQHQQLNQQHIKRNDVKQTVEAKEISLDKNCIKFRNKSGNKFWSRPLSNGSSGRVVGGGNAGSWSNFIKNPFNQMKSKPVVPPPPAPPEKPKSQMDLMLIKKLEDEIYKRTESQRLKPRETNAEEKLKFSKVFWNKSAAEETTSKRTGQNCDDKAFYNDNSAFSANNTPILLVDSQKLEPLLMKRSLDDTPSQGGNVCGNPQSIIIVDNSKYYPILMRYDIKTEFNKNGARNSPRQSIFLDANKNRKLEIPSKEISQNDSSTKSVLDAAPSPPPRNSKNKMLNVVKMSSLENLSSNKLPRVELSETKGEKITDGPGISMMGETASPPIPPKRNKKSILKKFLMHRRSLNLSFRKKPQASTAVVAAPVSACVSSSVPLTSISNSSSIVSDCNGCYGSGNHLFNGNGMVQYRNKFKAEISPFDEILNKITNNKLKLMLINRINRDKLIGMKMQRSKSVDYLNLNIGCRSDNVSHISIGSYENRIHNDDSKLCDSFLKINDKRWLALNWSTSDLDVLKHYYITASNSTKTTTTTSPTTTSSLSSSQTSDTVINKRPPPPQLIRRSHTNNNSNIVKHRLSFRLKRHSVGASSASSSSSSSTDVVVKTWVYRRRFIFY